MLVLLLTLHLQLRCLLNWMIITFASTEKKKKVISAKNWVDRGKHRSFSSQPEAEMMSNTLPTDIHMCCKCQTAALEHRCWSSHHLTLRFTHGWSLGSRSRRWWNKSFMAGGGGGWVSHQHHLIATHTSIRIISRDNSTPPRPPNPIITDVSLCQISQDKYHRNWTLCDCINPTWVEAVKRP